MDKVNNMTNSTHSSILDNGAGNSQFCDLSSVEENQIEENKVGNTYLDLNNAHKSKDRRGTGSPPNVIRTAAKMSEMSKYVAQVDPKSRANEHYFNKLMN